MKEIIKKLKKKYQQKYGLAVFNIVAKDTKSNSIEIEGKVLTENQKDEILKILKQKNIKDAKIKIKVLSNTDQRCEIGWAIVNVETADLKSRFVPNNIINNRILNRTRCSQASKNEILRVLFVKDDQLLVQQNDLTLGWINKTDVSVRKSNLRTQWKKRDNFALKNKIIKTTASKNNIVDEARDFVLAGSRYMLGGKSKNGIDCSGLTQLVYKKSLGIILPRHSWDQKKFGRKVKLEKTESGDLIFLLNKKNKARHVGIAVKETKLNLIHACPKRKKVVEQRFEDILLDYDFAEARRIVE